LHPNTVLKNPIFIPKLIHIDTSFAALKENIKAFLVPANFFTISKYKKLCESVIKNCEICIIDPVTNAFTYDGFLDKPTYGNLPYAPKAILTALELKSDSTRNGFVESVIEFQVSKGAGIIIAPYLFARDIDDGRFMVNLDLVSTSLRYVHRRKLKQPLFVMLNIGSSCIDNPRILDIITEQYSGFDVQGFFVCVENFDDRFVSYEQLMGFSYMCRKLATQHDVIVSPIASFGQVLCAIGINGFVGGIGWLETFHEVNLQRGRETFGGQQVPRAQYYYIPELFSYVRPDDMEAIFKDCRSMKTYRCKCEVCKSSLPTEPLKKKEHFLIRRFKEMENLSRIGLSDRPKHMRQRLELALALAEDIENEALIRIPTEHLVRWLNILDSLSTSPPPYSSEERGDLDELIHKVRGT
jgi:hypothetical protein